MFKIFLESSSCSLSLPVTPTLLLRNAVSDTFSHCSRSVSLSRFQSNKEDSSRQVSHTLLILLLLLCILLTKHFLVPGTHLHLQKEVNYRIWQWRLEYLGHVRKMNDGRYRKVALLGGVHGIKQRGWPKKILDRQHKVRL